MTGINHQASIDEQAGDTDQAAPAWLTAPSPLDRTIWKGASGIQLEATRLVLRDLAQAPALVSSASTPAMPVEYDLTRAVQQLRYVRFAEYCLIFIGLPLASQFFVQLIYALFLKYSGAGLSYAPSGSDKLKAVIVIAALFALAGFGIIAYLNSGKLKPSTTLADF